MATVKISHPNPLPVEEAKKRINEAFSTYSAKFNLKQRWEGDKLVLNGSGVEGYASVTDKSVDVELKLGFAASVFKGQVESGIKTELEKHLKA
jgi:putative polyhydroxyalkanoate system protein